MSNDLDRESLKLITETLGRARNAVGSLIGDTARHPAALLGMESAFCWLRGATLFHDTDYARDFLHFNALDPVGLGIQGARFVASRGSVIPFASSGIWNPGVYGPPSPEGWGRWEYNGWAGYRLSGGSFTTNSAEPSSGSGRAAYNYPVKYFSGSYVRVNLWQRARWISIKNTSGSAISNSAPRKVSFTLTEDDLAGIQVRGNDALPLDIRFCSHPLLIQTYTTSWQALAATPAENTALVSLGFSIVASGSPKTWVVTLNIAPDVDSDLNGSFDQPFVWPNNSWWHVVMYIGSTNSLPSAPLDASAATYAPASVLKWPRKNFFRKETVDRIGWEPLGINDTTPRLISRNLTNFNFVDGQYSDPQAPDRYTLPSPWPAAAIDGIANTLAGYSSLVSFGSALAVLICVRNDGSLYGYPSALPEIVVGPEITAEFQTGDWENCPYFPPTPDSSTVIARVILKRLPGVLYGSVEGTNFRSSSAHGLGDSGEAGANRNVLSQFGVAWLERTVSTHAREPLGDPNLSRLVMPSLQEALSRLRVLDYKGSISNAAFSVIVSGARMPETLITSPSDFSNPASRQSVVFRGLLKKPTAASLLPSEDEPRAIQFDQSGRNVIEDLAGASPSTELMRLQADHLSVTNQRLGLGSKLEIFLSPYPLCGIVDPNAAGTSTGQDYTFRLKILDTNNNTFTKDWQINASRFFLNDAEFNHRETLGLSTTGYFKRGTKIEQSNLSRGTLQTMPEFRTHGYAAIVPDLRQGDSRTLMTKVVSPEDETKTTEEQFRKNLENQGLSPSEIDEAVSDYLFEGGEFYVVDLHQYPNDNFVGLQEAAVNVSQYTTDNPYWKVNLNPYFGYSNADGQLPSTEEVRADSFTIAPQGLSAGDLEKDGLQSIFHSTKLGMRMPASSASSINQVTIRLKAVLSQDNPTSALSNSSTAGINVSLYSSAAGLPNALVASGGTIRYGDIPSGDFIEIPIGLKADLVASTDYWIVLEKSEDVEGGWIVYSTTGSAVGKISTRFGAFAKEADDYQPSFGTAWIKAYDIDGNTSIDGSGSTGYEEPFIQQYYAIRLTTGSAPIKKIGVRLQTSANLTNAEEDTIQVIACDSRFVPINTAVEVLALRDISTSLTEYQFTFSSPLAQIGTYWVVLKQSSAAKGGIIFVDRIAQPVDRLASRVGTDPWQNAAGNPWYRTIGQSADVLAAFNLDSYQQFDLPPVNSSRSLGANYKVDGHWAYTCRGLEQPQLLAIYPRAFYDPTTDAWKYAKFYRDIYVVVRLMVEGNLVKFTKKFSASPGWRAIWWNRTSDNFNVIDDTSVVSSDSIVTQIDFTNFNPKSQSDYYNGRFTGSFTPKYSEAYILKVVTANGARVWLNDVLVIDQWLNTSETSFEYTTSTLDNTHSYSFRIEHYSGVGNQRLKLTWRSASQSEATVSPFSAVDPSPLPIQLGTVPATGVAYLAVGKTAAELDTPTNGAPPGDRLVIRNV